MTRRIPAAAAQDPPARVDLDVERRALQPAAAAAPGAPWPAPRRSPRRRPRSRIAAPPASAREAKHLRCQGPPQSGAGPRFASTAPPMLALDRVEDAARRAPRRNRVPVERIEQRRAGRSALRQGRAASCTSTQSSAAARDRRDARRPLITESCRVAPPIAVSTRCRPEASRSVRSRASRRRRALPRRLRCAARAAARAATTRARVRAGQRRILLGGSALPACAEAAKPLAAAGGGNHRPNPVPLPPSLRAGGDGEWQARRARALPGSRSDRRFRCCRPCRVRCARAPRAP